ncbi:MAG: tetratricopeptide repeat protein, partial [Caulobacteraceae bacterium]
MVGSIRPFLLSLTCALAVSAATTPAAAAPPSQTKAADQGKSGAAQADRASVFALPGEDPPPPFVPLHPRTVEDRKRIEALTDFSAARALESKHAWTDSIALLEQALKLEPDSVAVLRRLSRLCFALGRNEQAVKYSKQALAADPGDTDTLGRLVAYFAHRKNDPTAAEEVLKGVLADPRLDPHSSGRLLAEFELGRLYAGK